MVVVHQCPAGALSTTRAPPMIRPYRRVMLVLAPLSSRKTRRCGSTWAMRSRHAARCAVTSGRSCSLACRDFFAMAAQPLQCPMDRHDAGVDAGAIQQLLQRCVRLLVNPGPELVEFLAAELGGLASPATPGREVPARPSALQQPTYPCRADAEKLGNLLPCAALLITCPHDPFPQVIGVGLHAYSIGYRYESS